MLTAGGAAGALVFLPLVAVVAERWGWRPAALGVAFAALAVVPFVVWLLRDRPRDLGVAPYGGTAADDVDPVPGRGRPAGRARRCADAGPHPPRSGTWPAG